IQSIYLSISFNSSLLNATIENGNAFNTFIPVINNSTGIIQITAFNFTKNGILANITFSTLQGGIANIYVSSVTAIDKNFTTVYTHNENATVEILIDDIPPTTTLQHGMPYYNDYITSSTPLYINATDAGSGVKEIHYIIDGTEYIAYGNTTIYLTGDDGWHTIKYYSIDNVDNKENMTNISFYLDNTPPTTTLEYGLPYYNDYITSSTPLYINASDDGAGVKEIHYIIDGVEHIAYGNVVINITGDDGWHNIEYYSIDALGNEEQHHVAMYYLDNTPPTTSIQFGLPYYYNGNHWVTSDTPLYFNATDDSGIAATWYRIYNGTAWSNWSQCTASFSLSADGMNYIEFYSIDNVGNEEQHHNVTVYVDNNPPVVHYSVEPSSPDGENGWYRMNVNFNLTAYDNESGLAEIMYKINNGIWQLYNGTIEFTNDGEYTIQFYAKDNVENNNSNSILIKIDRVSPSSRCDFSGKYSNGKYTTDVTVTITASDAHAGVKEIYYSVDGGAWHKVSGAKATTVVTSEGAHTVEYYAVDKAGNEEQHHVAAFTIEKNKPPIASFEYTPLQPYDTDKIKFDASSSYDSDGSIVNYTWQFGDGSVGYGKIVYHKYGENKEYNVTLVVKDDKGASDKITKKIVVANKPPIADFTHTPKKPNVGEKVKFDASISMDDDGNIVNYTWHFEDGTIEYGKIVNYTYEKEGNYSVTLVVTDDDGATATITGYIIVRKEISNIWLPLTIILILAIIAIALVTIWKKRTKS
ncbi:MAG: PKD domain-containing protein, partial [Thermoplasmata archaeon]|nr:PKD domain-containing protein [Thermoplasmata archaeon]